ncbi:MAG: hypothetical protein HYX84_02780 [Chloroflexi bacterium]|nr:hypothetical protein [Chloroflexota bacterium]
MPPSGSPFAGEKPLFPLRITEIRATVMIQLEDFTLNCLYAVIVPVMALPPFLAVERTAAKTVVRPRIKYFGDMVLATIQSERRGRFDFAAYGDLDFATDKLLWHGSSLPGEQMKRVPLWRDSPGFFIMEACSQPKEAAAS